jgi:hypothetical protein
MLSKQLFKKLSKYHRQEQMNLVETYQNQKKFEKTLESQG